MMAISRFSMTIRKHEQEMLKKHDKILEVL
eukprot:COSAG01_NODE_70998_length_257_cov_0.651899_1_plen_29_part_10